MAQQDNDMFLKYMHSFAQQLGSMFSEEAAGTVQDAFFKNLNIKKGRSVKVNDDINRTNREKEILNLQKELQERIMNLKGVPTSEKEAIEISKNSGGSSIDYIRTPPRIRTKIGSQESPIFGGDGTNSNNKEYNEYTLQGGEYAAIVDNFVKRATGKSSNLTELVTNAMSNIRNIPLAMFYGENVPIGDMKDLLTYALYNKAKEYNPMQEESSWSGKIMPAKMNSVSPYRVSSSGAAIVPYNTPISSNANTPSGRFNLSFTPVKNKNGRYLLPGIDRKVVGFWDVDSKTSYQFRNEQNGDIYVDKFNEKKESIGSSKYTEGDATALWNSLVKKERTGKAVVAWREIQPWSDKVLTTDYKDKSFAYKGLISAFDNTTLGNRPIFANEIEDDAVSTNNTKEADAKRKSGILSNSIKNIYDQSFGTTKADRYNQIAVNPGTPTEDEASMLAKATDGNLSTLLTALDDKILNSMFTEYRDISTSNIKKKLQAKANLISAIIKQFDAEKGN